MSAYECYPDTREPQSVADAETDAALRFDRMSMSEIVALANAALDPDDHASAVWPLRHKLCAHLAQQIRRGEA